MFMEKRWDLEPGKAVRSTWSPRREPLLRNRLARDMETGNSMWTGKRSREKQLWIPSASLAFSGKNHTSSKTSAANRSEEHTSELQSRFDLVCRLLLEKKK